MCHIIGLDNLESTVLNGLNPLALKVNNVKKMLRVVILILFHKGKP